jgi:hypothetical protein
MPLMDEDRLIRLLEEIRDLQRQQVDAYARALSNQQEALRMQREWMGRSRMLLAGLSLAIVVVLVIVLLLLRYILLRYT